MRSIIEASILTKKGLQLLAQADLTHKRGSND